MTTNVYHGRDDVVAKAVMKEGYFDAAQDIGIMAMVAILINSIGKIAINVKDSESRITDTNAINRAISIVDVNIRHGSGSDEIRDRWVEAGNLAIASVSTMTFRKNDKGKTVASVLT
ncbi:MAG: hypothetical protein KAS32_05790 [Candidatus Peribacteraceae bacterium]|nr:hypothetical protein [Candidatus Peribacteraceae bacterium]